MKSATRHQFLLAASALGIIVLSLIAHYYPISVFDLYITKQIQQERGIDLTYLMKFISSFGNAWIAPLSVLFASLIFYLSKHRREAYYIFAVFAADILNVLFKFMIHRPRPTLEDVQVLSKFTHPSFPSGHVVHYVVFFGFILVVMLTSQKFSRFWRILIGGFSAFLVLTVAISRIYLGAHWATDVMGGYLFGFIYLSVILRIYFKDLEGRRG